jgi:putative sporulation protein YtaF
MSVLNAFVLACSTNLDNLAVGLAFGARPALHFGTAANGIIALLSFLSTFVSVSLGAELLRWVPSPAFVRQIAAVALLIVALVLLVDALKTRSNDTSVDDINLKHHHQHHHHHHQSHVSARDAFGIGLALTLTNLGTGIVGGLHALNPLIAACFSAMTSFVAIGAGLCIGRAATNVTASAWPSVASSLLLAVFAIRVLITESHVEGLDDR